MHQIRLLIQHLSDGFSIREISRRLSISRNTVRTYIRQLRTSSLDWTALLALEDQKLQHVVYPPSEDYTTSQRYQILEERFAQMERELLRKGVTRYLLWIEYRELYPDGYQYVQFCHHFRTWQEQRKTCLHIEHKAGDKLFVDFAGSKLHLTDAKTGEHKEVEVFVATLGCSQRTYVKAVHTQRKEDFLACLSDAFVFFGGVPAAVVPDNLKPAVTKADRYEPELNPAIADLALHYHTTILPARARKPQDKPLVENGVHIAYSRIYAPLRNQSFYTLSELNAAILELVNKHNQTNFQGKDYSRQDVFDAQEKEALRPLPPTAYQLKQYQQGRVQKNCHVQLLEDKHFYSVPFRYANQRVKLIYSATSVEIYHQYERIAVHQRERKAFSYSTQKQHLPAAHQWVLNWRPEQYTQPAATIGPATLQAIEILLASRKHKEQAYKSCQGVLSLEKKVGKERLEKACKRAVSFGEISYQLIRTILDKGLEELSPQTTSEAAARVTGQYHENVRGSSAYQ